MARLVRLANNAVSRLAANITTSSTTITLLPGEGSRFPSLTGSQYFMGTLVKSDGTTEVLKVTARTTDTLTVVRAAEAIAGVTSPYPFAAGDRFEGRLTAGIIAGALDTIDTVQGVAEAAQADADTAQATADAVSIVANAALPKAGGVMTGDLTMGAGTKIIMEGTTDDAFEVVIDPGNPTADRTITLPDLSGTVAFSDQPQTFTKAQRGSVVPLTDGATITPDFSAGNNFSVTLGGNRTLANPTNLTAGQSGVISLTQDGTGSRTLAFGSYWKFTSGTVPSLTTTAGAADELVYLVRSSTHITAALRSDVR